MKVLYYDCFSGISGDMNLGALVDLGVDPDYLQKELLKLGLTGYQMKIKSAQRKGITGTRVEIVLDDSHHHNHNHNHTLTIMNMSTTTPKRTETWRISSRLY